MKKLLYTAMLCAGAAITLSSCLGDEPGSDKEWKKKNDAWIIEKEAETDASGQKVYTRVNCDWDPSAYVLMKWHNDRAATSNNLSPISTSTINVKYRVQNIDGLGLDSSYLRTTPADSIYQCVLNTNIQGWIIALGAMHVGDSCTVLIPYNQAYGMNTRGSIKAYSNLVFDVKLVSIPALERPLN